MASRITTTGGGAALVSPNGIKPASTAGAGRGSYAGYDAKADQMSKAKSTRESTNTPLRAAASTNANPDTTPSLSSSKNGGSFMFPSDLPVYMLMMRFGPYRREVAMDNKKVDHDLFIALPLPANLNESFGASYNNVSMGPFGKPMIGAIGDVAQSIGSGGDWTSELRKKMEGGLKALRQDSTGWATLLSDAARKAGGESLGLGVDMYYGMTPNPNLAVGFQGVPLRSYGFSWKFSPKTPEESQTLIDIIYRLKHRMHPEKQGFALRYPDYCNVSVHSTQLLKDLIKYKTSVLTDMRVNYAPNGVPSFFAKTQMPTEIEMSLSFREIEIFTRADFETAPKIDTGR
jgi:hypothetical protein